MKWKNEGAERNQSYWLDAGELEVGYVKDGRRIEDEDLEALGVGGLAVRLTMHPVGVDKMCLYGGIIPMSKSELRDMLGSDDPHMDSPYIPTMCLKLMWSKGKALNAFPLSFLPVEKETDKVGLGHLPLLELVGRVEPIFPKHDDIEEQLCAFLGNLAATNNMKLQRLSLMLSPGCLPNTVTGCITFQWPEYRDAKNSSQPIIMGMLILLI